MRKLDPEVEAVFEKVMDPREFVDFVEAIKTDGRSELAKSRRSQFQVIDPDR